ncbi:Xaa-Pro dipeptidyl-peptidase [Paractinoplanes hotanensis]|uniref:Xaa-Pro dipeptidyl-peptidase n=1 Tax=Paractinoplanes hotanensis TaxID=2906497 RepID=A0ABT0XXV0_9ACTN|nr:Xaa-Pro dipeptidyl-peptidase [Actinoplanes hotanensis]MCM4078584.1 Xaa-Pro dipeptidyl-peptidase [Actinoplanes hotanensis]
MSGLRMRALAVAVAAGVGATLTIAVAPAEAAGTPHIRAGETVPVYSYENAVRESVWVQTTLDNDLDGVPDRVAVDIVRPREAADRRIKVPVILEASPYYSCCGRGNESELKEYDANGTITKQPLFYDNFFVPRGYAFVAADLAGTGRSTGCMDVGGREEVLSAKAVVDWLNGRGRATYADGTPAVATGWTNGRTGMIGKSWDGSVANGVAATGVEGLETIVPISAISSWYDYQRYNGVLRAEDYPEYLHEVVNGRPEGVCAATLKELDEGSDDATGNYNGYWAERDFRRDARKVRASVLVAHGLNDTNVTTTQFAQWWDRLNVPKKIWLPQQGHVDPFDIRRAEWVETLHQWFDRWLQGLRNGIEREPQATIETAPGTWVNERTWPAAARSTKVALGNGNGTTGTLGGRSGSGFRTWTDAPDLSEAAAVANPAGAVPGRVAFLSGPLAQGVRISGAPSVSLRVQVDRPTTELTARLVDYGTATRVNYQARGEGITTLTTESCWGASTTADDACYRDTAENVVTSDHAVLARGWQDAAHRVSLRFVTPLQPGRWYTVTVPMQATDQRIAAGHVLGLILQASDDEYSTPQSTGATIRLDLRGSSLRLPLVGRLPAPAATAPSVSTAPSANRSAPQRFQPLLP